ncbi:alpha/beta hydrolase family protein [Shewanella zhangzhouensis]|uniref:alpha/beta hydrolase family protein n=1 Tax=Shewanella zhangzhouensis TaxID=2864213 RepID=UPI001C65F0E1|nr:S9 family peptidase [Shewanella zhangzhouensis]QYK05667.1 S9 family peptidase [Shewanella zhangzhouensis]
MKKTLLTLSLATLALAGCQSTQSNQGADTAANANATNNQDAATAKQPYAKPLLLAHPRYDAKTFFDTTSYTGSSISADGSAVLVGSDESGIYNLYRLSLLDGSKTQLTNFEDSTFPVRWFPGDDRVLLSKDKGGNELNHLYVRELDGSVKDLTPGDNTRASFAGFSGDGTVFFVQTNERNPKFMDLYRYDARTYERTLVFQNDEGYSLGDIDRSGRFVALNKSVSNKDIDIYLLDLRSRALKPVMVSEPGLEAAEEVFSFSHDGRTLYYGSDAKSEFNEVWAYDIASGTRKPIASRDWDVSYYGFSDSGRYQAMAVNADASTKVTITDTQTGKALALPPLPPGDFRGVSFSKDDKTMVFYLNSDISPSELYVWQIGEPSVKRLTKALSPAMDSANLVPSEVVRFKSFDGLEIPGLLYRPKLAHAASPSPAVIYVHGGPGGQSRSGYNPAIQHLVNHGYVVFAINNRGSSGYGKTFFHLDDKKHGDGDLKDMVWGKKYLQSLDWVDKERIGIMGGSYGGYMVAAALAFTPEEFKVGIDIFGVTNWVRTLNSIPPWWESFRKSLYDEMGDPATDAERHKAISPLFHAEKIVRPLMVIQGANDPRVLQVESDELVEKVRANGVPVEYVLFDDEGHGFTKKANRITASEAYLKFLDTYLKP